MQHRITEPGPLLGHDGELLEPGYATSLLSQYRRTSIKAKSGRIKEWDYYCVLNDHFGIALTIDDNSYMGLVSATLLDFDNKSYITKTFMKAFPFGSTLLPPVSSRGTTKAVGKGYLMAFLHENEESLPGSSSRVLTVKIRDFHKRKPLEAAILLTDEPQDSMVIATPFPEKPGHFYYNQKINCLRAKGVVRYNGRQYEFNPSDSLGVLDWGRGVWTYENTWHWASMSCMAQGVPLGFNLGYGFGDTSAATENMIFYNGHASKLENVDFGIPQKDGKDDFLSPWHFTSPEGRVDLTFQPLFDRHEDTNVLLIRSNQHQVFGRYSGTLILDDGTRITLQDKIGFAEKVHNKW